MMPDAFLKIMKMPREIPLIINRYAGRKSYLAVVLEKQIIQPPGLNEHAFLSGKQVEAKVTEAFRQEGLKVRPYFTEGPAHATKLAADLVRNGEKFVVAVGGDGTLNEVANGLIGSDTALGIVPLGTANTFAIELGLPFTLREAARVIKNAKTRLIDVGKVGSHYFVMGSGMSFDAHVIQRVNPNNKKLLGSLAYILHGVWESLTYSFPLMKLKAGDPDFGEMDGRIVVVSNARYYGGAFKAAPRAKLDDGLLDVLVIKKKWIGDLLYYVAVMKNGDVTKLPGVQSFQCRSLEISSDPSVPVHVDAEIRENTPCRFECVPQALRVLVP